MTIRGFSNYTESEMVLFDQWKGQVDRAYRSHGFTPVTMRPVERLVDLQKKGGVNHQIFSINQVQNEGEAKLGLPFDRTVPLALWVNQYSKQMAFPLKRSDINYSFRGEKAQTGRFRAFYQADVDIIDKSVGLLAEVECISTVYRALKGLEIGEFTMCLNNMMISKTLALSLNLKAENQPEFLRIIDKIEKISKQQTIEEIQGLDSNLDPEKVKNLVELFSYRGTLADFPIPENLKSDLEAPIAHLLAIFDSLKSLGVDDKNIVFSPSMVRGLDYYTGVVFETFLEGRRQFGSIASGGRYDNLLEGVGGSEHLEGVGGSIGLTRLFDVCIKEKIVCAAKASTADVMVTCRDDSHLPLVLEVTAKLREEGLNVDLYSGTATQVKKKLNWADKKGIPFVVVVMDPESFVVKDMKNNTQSDLAKAALAVQNLLERMMKPSAVEKLTSAIKG